MKKKKGELPSGRVRYCAYIGRTEDGKQIRKNFTADSMKEAKQKAALWLLTHKAPTVATLRSALTDYVKMRGPVLSPSTLKTYQSIIDHLETPLLNYRLDAITNSDMQQLINELSADHSPKTVRNIYGLINAACDAKNARFNVKLPAKERPNTLTPGAETVKVITSAVKDTELEIPVLLGVMGLRRGEICALQYPDDFDGNTVHIHGSMVIGPDKKYHLKQPKTYTSDRFIVLPAQITAKIKKRGYVTVYNPLQITHRFQRLCKSLDLPPYRFHALRSFMVSYLHAEGVPDAYIQKAGGWSTDYVMKQVYRKTLQDQERAHQRKAAESMKALF